jgi:hypothetical protein
MALVAETRPGPYEIMAPLGAGGMCEVYRTHTFSRATLCILVLVAVFVTGGTAKSPAKKDLQQRRIARGKYLVEGPAHCFGCHSEPDIAHGSDQPAPGRKGVGNVVPAELAQTVGIPLSFRVGCPNITPKIAGGVTVPALLRSGGPDGHGSR